MKENIKENQIDLSVITICFNSASTIGKTLNSVIQQTKKPLEHIIIDGESTDKTLDIINEYKQKCSYDVKIFSKKDRGISDAFNKGIIEASSTWTHLLNSDDFYLNSNILEEIQKILNNCSAEIVFCGGIFENANKSLSEKYSSVFKGSLKYSMSVIHPSSFVKKSLFEKVGFFSESYKTAMDYEWLTRAEKMMGKEIFKFVNLLSTFISYGGESTKNQQRGFREVASAQMVNTNLSIIYIFLRYLIYTFFFTTKIGLFLKFFIKSGKKYLI